jgi:hypothetical protein
MDVRKPICVVSALFKGVKISGLLSAGGFRGVSGPFGAQHQFLTHLVSYQIPQRTLPYKSYKVGLCCFSNMGS